MVLVLVADADGGFQFTFQIRLRYHAHVAGSTRHDRYIPLIANIRPLIVNIRNVLTHAAVDNDRSDSIGEEA